MPYHMHGIHSMYSSYNLYFSPECNVYKCQDRPDNSCRLLKCHFYTDNTRRFLPKILEPIRSLVFPLSFIQTSKMGQYPSNLPSDLWYSIWHVRSQCIKAHFTIYLIRILFFMTRSIIQKEGRKRQSNWKIYGS